MNMHNLFPTPVAFFNLGRDLTDDELKFLLGQEQRPNQGNSTSKDNLVLRHKAMTGLRQFIEDSMAEYFAATANPKGNVHLRVTQSWLNYTYPGQSHHAHMHDNSFISGVLYINADRSTDSIVIHSGRPQAIRLTTSKFNEFNSETWTIPVGTGDLMLFPSKMTHHVPATPTDREITRVSLAFNTFLRGEIGDPGQRIHLVLR